MCSGKGIRTNYEAIHHGAKHILLFPGKGHSLPGVAPAFQLVQPFPESFKALRSLNRSRGFFFPGEFFPVYLPIKINRGIAHKRGQSSFAYFLTTRTEICRDDLRITYCPPKTQRSRS